MNNRRGSKRIGPQGTELAKERVAEEGPRRVRRGGGFAEVMHRLTECPQIGEYPRMIEHAPVLLK